MIAAVRVRGVPDTRKKARQTMETIHLNAPNNCVLVPDTPQYQGMLQRAKDYLTYGPVSDETVAALLSQATLNGERLGDNIDVTGFDSIDALVAALDAEETTVFKLRDKGLQLPFQLSPPSKGYRDTKRHVRQGGSLGKRESMDELLHRMM